MNNNKMLLLLFLTFTAQVAAVEFTYQLPLETNQSADATGYELQLPPVVYEKTTNPMIRDLRVKNAQGDDVPMRMTLLQDEIKQSLSATTLPIFSLNQTISTPLRSQQVSTTWQGDVRQFSVETSESVQNYIRSQEQVLHDRLLLDASLVKTSAVAALELQWQFDRPGNRVFYVELKGSHDLSSWQILAAKHKLIELNTGQKVILENTIALNGQTFNYYQLRFLGEPVPVVTEVKALLKSHALEQPLLTRVVGDFEVLETDKYGHAIVWDTGGYFPIEKVDIDFDYKNLMAEVQLYARNSLNSPWQQVISSQLYQVGSGDMAMEKNSLSFRANHNRFWKLTSQSSISSQWVKGVSLSWRPHQIQFLAQGSGPYSLFFASKNLKSLPSNGWYQQLNNKMKTNLFSNQIKLGSLQVLTPKPKKPDPEPESPIGRWLFWGLLVVVLSVLFIMANRLMKEVSNEDN